MGEGNFAVTLDIGRGETIYDNPETDRIPDAGITSVLATYEYAQAARIPTAQRKEVTEH
jgi:hypothetical protein